MTEFGQDFITTLSEQVTETHEEFIFETIRPYCENVVNMKISKRDLEQALLKYYGKNDLVVDCISRAEVNQVIEDYMDEQYHVLSDRTRQRAFGARVVMARINELSSVTPQEPKTGHWISHREHCENLGVIPSGLGAYKWCSNCDCGIDVREWHTNNYNYCPNCGAKMIEPQESENKE